MLTAAIIGSTGYTGAELARLLARHPFVRLAELTTRQYAGKRFSDVFPAFKGIVDTVCIEYAADAISADIVFTALPHHESQQVVKEMVAAGRKVVDLSADFRFTGRQLYEQWYGPHDCFELVGDAVYGLPEVNRERIRTTGLVANPGCYVTSALIPLHPLLKERLIAPDDIIVDSASGVTGAGRGLSLGTHFCETYASYRAYNVTKHRHQPEMEERLSAWSGLDVRILFTPHLLPVKRGILSTIYARPVKAMHAGDVMDVFRRYYGSEPFVRLCEDDDLPAVDRIVGSNFCDVAVRFDAHTGRLVIMSALDNLCKGASGQAVQNMNLMCGFPETASLEASLPVCP